jgi:hypothetical protein
VEVVKKTTHKRAHSSPQRTRSAAENFASQHVLEGEEENAAGMRRREDKDFD